MTAGPGGPLCARRGRIPQEPRGAYHSAMGSYRNEDEALIGLARQLTDAYGEARRREDQDFACDSISEFLSEYRGSAPSQALLALLDLPLTAETYPLVDEAQTELAARGPAVVELLLEAVLGEVYDPDGPAPERAAEILDMMDRRDAAQGLVEVLCGRAGDDVKGAAVDGLAALGTFAEPALAATLDDPRGGEWAEAALSQIRYAREHGGAADADGAPEDEEFRSGLRSLQESLSSWLGAGPYTDTEEAEDDADEDDARGDDGEASDEDDEDREAERAGDGDAAGSDETAGDASAQETAGDAGADPATPAGPDQQAVDDAYDEFLRRYRQESGEGPVTS